MSRVSEPCPDEVISCVGFKTDLSVGLAINCVNTDGSLREGSMISKLTRAETKENQNKNVVMDSRSYIILH